MQHPPQNIKLARQALRELVSELPSAMTYGMKWEEINFFDSEIQKPSKEEFEAKLQELIDAQPLKKLREERNKRLSECDWVVIRAVSTNTQVPDEWITYMQTLRDLPANTDDPENPMWPTPPN